MTTLRWSMDERTAKAAAAYPFRIERDTPAAQFGGCLTTAQTWNDCVVQPPTWKNGSLLSSPAEIIKQFQDRRYTQALALEVSWGGMGRTSQYIYGGREPERIEQIERTLRECAKSIEESRSIADSWGMLTGWKDDQLGWSSVMASKTLHFLCRSLGFEQDPPVPIDGKRIREGVWPIFRDSVPINQRPADWAGESFEAYGRYMTAILTWAAQKHWTTAQVEATLINIIGLQPSCCPQSHQQGLNW
jgi:hypothetical protein